MTYIDRAPASGLVRLGALAGLAGGSAEVLWVTLYGALAGADPSAVARGVVRAVAGGTAASAAWAPAAGLLIHLLLAVALGIALAFASRPLSVRYGGWLSDYGLFVAALALVWKVNFFLVLPLLSPSFVTLLPFSVTLASKLMFGLAAATVLRARGARSRMRVARPESEKEI